MSRLTASSRYSGRTAIRRVVFGAMCGASLIGSAARADDAADEPAPAQGPAEALIIPLAGIAQPVLPSEQPIALAPAPAEQPAPPRLSARMLGYGLVLAPGCGLATLSSDGARGGNACPFSDFSTGVGLFSRLDGFESRVAVARSARSPWSPISLVTQESRGWSDESNALLTGFAVTLLDGRVRIEGDHTFAESWQAPLAASPYEPAKRASRHATASRARIEVKPIERHSLAWVFAAERSVVGGWFPLEQGMLLESALSLPGESFALSSLLRLGQTRVRMSHDEYASDYGRSSTQRLAVYRDGIGLHLTARRFSTEQTPWLGLGEMRQSSFSAGIDLDTGSAGSGLLERLGRSPLFPRSLSLLYRRGREQTGLGLRYDRDTWDLSATWETGLGETSLGYSTDRRTGRDGTLGQRQVETVQIDHTVRRGAWRIGADAAFTTSRASGITGFDDSAVGFGAILAYQHTGGPEFRLRVGHDETRMRLNDRSYLSEDRGLQVSAVLDLTQFLQNRFERDDLRLRLEYRRSLLDSHELFPGLDEYSFDPLVRRRDRNVVQLSFGMRL